MSLIFVSFLFSLVTAAGWIVNSWRGRRYPFAYGEELDGPIFGVFSVYCERLRGHRPLPELEAHQRLAKTPGPSFARCRSDGGCRGCWRERQKSEFAVENTCVSLWHHLSKTKTIWNWNFIENTISFARSKCWFVIHKQHNIPSHCAERRFVKCGNL